MKFRKIITIVIIVSGIGLITYPFISNYLYDNSAKSKIDSFKTNVKDLSESRIKEKLRNAQEYNRKLREKSRVFTDPFEEKADKLSFAYKKLLSLNSEGLMGYIEIPAIDLYLPVYHTSIPEVLEKGAGHLQGSSLPIGGKGTHAVITGHTGLNHAKMFTDLTHMEVGDYFYIHVLNKRLVYKVYDTVVIKPDDISRLSIINGKDYVTLITCTPYGINSHRLLIMGERVETDKVPQNMNKKHYISQWQADYLKSILIGMLASLGFIIFCLVHKRFYKKI